LSQKWTSVSPWPEVIGSAFKGTVSRMGGLTMDELAAETALFASSNFPGEAEVMSGIVPRGMFQVKPNLEYHANNQSMSKLLHKAVDLGGKGPGSEAGAYTCSFLSSSGAMFMG